MGGGGGGGTESVPTVKMGLDAKVLNVKIMAW